MTARGARAGLILALAGGALVAAARLGSQSLWIDEAITLVPVTSANDAADLLVRVRTLDTQPPASHALLFALRPVLPANEFGWRLPSLLAVEAGVLLLALLGGRLFGPSGVLWTGVCAQVSPYLLFYAMEARNYALWFFAVAAAAYAMTRFVQAIGAGAPARAVALWAIVWTLANALGLWTHFFHVFALLVQGVVLGGVGVVRRPARPAARFIAAWSAASLLGSVVLFLPWLLIALSSQEVAQGVGWTRRLASTGLLYFPFALLFGFSFGPDLRELHERHLPQIALAHPAALLLAGAAIAILLAGIGSLTRRKRGAAEAPPAAVLYLLAPAAGLLGPALFAFARDFPLVPRHLMFLWPLLPLLQAQLALKRRPFRGAVVAIVALQAVAAFNLLFNPTYAKDDERGAVRFAETHSGPKPLILGDAAPLYAARGIGLMKAFTDPGSHAVIGSEATDLWLVDNRPWEDPDGRMRDKAAQAAGRLGLVEAESDERFRGLVLRHWQRAGAPRTGEKP
jgi:uncharacterized membrane protein